MILEMSDGGVFFLWLYDGSVFHHSQLLFFVLNCVLSGDLIPFMCDLMIDDLMSLTCSAVTVLCHGCLSHD